MEGLLDSAHDVLAEAVSLWEEAEEVTRLLPARSASGSAADLAALLGREAEGARK